MTDEEHVTLDDILLGATVIEIIETVDEEDGEWTVFRLDNGFEMHTQGTILIVPPTVN